MKILKYWKVVLSLNLILACLVDDISTWLCLSKLGEHVYEMNPIASGFFSLIGINFGVLYLAFVDACAITFLVRNLKYWYFVLVAVIITIGRGYAGGHNLDVYLTIAGY